MILNIHEQIYSGLYGAIAYVNRENPRNFYCMKILENEDKREVMRKEARNEAEKWDWNQATLQLQNYYANTLKKID